MTYALNLHADPAALREADTLVLVGRKRTLTSPEVERCLPDNLSAELWRSMLQGDGGELGRVSSNHCLGKPSRVYAGLLPEAAGRALGPTRAAAIPGLLRGHGRGRIGVLIALEHVDHALAAVAGLARAYPTWTAVASPERAVDVVLLGPDGPIPITPLLQATARAVRLAAHWTDTPPDRLGPDALVTAANAVARELPGVSVHSVRGDALREHGLNLLHAVGRAALQSPALVVLDYAPEGATAHHAWVGKGICYDTGGLSIKPRANMTGMKMDMAGAAAVLAAFDAAVRAGSDKRLTAVLCIAENAVGPAAIRPDDVVVGYSGKSVEINNTDAEGRLVLADGLAWVMRHRAPDRVVDIATLTGAQSAAVGRGIGAVYAPNEDLEAWAMRIGLAAAEPMHPLPVAPEWWRPELSSPVADMRNSAKNRDNAGSAVAAHFLAEHLGEAVDRWVHLDIAGPANQAGRATGFGTAWLIRSLYEP